MTLTQRHKIFAALLLWSWLFSISHLLAADLPVVRASYNAIGGVFTPLWLAQENLSSCFKKGRRLASVVRRFS